MKARCSTPETICLQCGDKGFNNAFVYCIKCLKYAVHRYCMDVIPKSFDAFVRWVCDDCQLELKKPNDAILCKTRGSTPPKHTSGTSGVGTEKNDIVALEIEEPLNECEMSQSIEVCRKPRFVECAESADERYAQSSCKWLQKHKINDDLICDDNLSTDAPAKVNMKIKKSAIEVSKRAREKCANVGSNECEKLTCDSTLSMEVKENKPSKKKKTNMFYEDNLEEHRNRTLLAQHLNQYKQETVSEDGDEIRESEVSEDITAACHHESNFHKGFSKDSTISPMVDCHVRVVPLMEPIWSGSFNLWNKKDDILEGIMAHMSSRACQKVQDEACQFQPVLHLEILPKSEVWPESFRTSEPSAENIALYFFPSDIRNERCFDYLVDEMVQYGLALRAIVQNAELLVFTSTELPLPCWRFQGKYYLWGVFQQKQHQALRSQTCSMEPRYNSTMREDGVGETASSEGKIPVTMKSFGARSPLSSLSNCSSYASHTS